MGIESELSPGPLGFLDTRTLETLFGLFNVSFLGDWVSVLPSGEGSPNIRSLAAWYLASRSPKDSEDVDDGGGVGDLEFDSEDRLSMRMVG